MLTEIRQSTEQQKKSEDHIVFSFFFYPNNSVRLSSTAIRTYFISSLSLIAVLKKKDPICGVTEAVETEHVSTYLASFPQKKTSFLFYQANTSFLFSLCYCLLSFLVCFSFTLFFFFTFGLLFFFLRFYPSAFLLSSRPFKPFCSDKQEGGKKTCWFCPIKKENEKLGLLCPRFCLIVDHIAV